MSCLDGRCSEPAGTLPTLLRERPMPAGPAAVYHTREGARGFERPWWRAVVVNWRRARGSSQRTECAPGCALDRATASACCSPASPSSMLLLPTPAADHPSRALLPGPGVWPVPRLLWRFPRRAAALAPFSTPISWSVRPRWLAFAALTAKAAYNAWAF